MSTTSELFWKAMGRGLIKPGDKEALQLLMDAASHWREDGKYFNAAYAMSSAVHAACGDEEQVNFCIGAALQDYQHCVEAQDSCSHESFAALIKWSAEFLPIYYSESKKAGILQFKKSLWEELGQRLLTCYGNSSHAENYLVRGILLESDLQRDWEPSFPIFEVRWGEERRGKGVVTINLPSAFHLFVALGDYQGAQAVIELCPDAFTTPGLRGWRAAVRGFVKSDEAPERFDEAANAFAEDCLPSNEDLIQCGGSWSSVNTDLWSKYFRSRSALATAVREPNRVKELVRTAAEAVQGTEYGWHDGKVSRYRILIQTLAQLIGVEPSLSPEQARKQFLQEGRLTGEEVDDTTALQFLTLASQAFEGFKTDPAQELTTGRLPMALDALARIPLIGPDVTNAVEPAIGAKAVDEFHGPVRTWIYRTLESINPESRLQKVILRLLQAYLPLYAQIRCGPIEYGKDVVVLLEEDGRRVLRIYQVKCGDINKRNWNEAKNELEEMFLVPLPNLQISGQVDFREGILVCNGHANPFVEPVMEGWFREQKRAYDRNFHFMHLDEIVRWISDKHLVNEFREALADVGLEPVG
jgi:hypothetical protein